MSQLTRTFLVITIIVAGLAITAVRAQADTLTVGPDKQFAFPSQAAAVAKDGDVIEIYSANYRGDVAIWPQDDLAIVGIADKPIIHAGGNAAAGKAIWVIKGNNALIQNLEFTEARVSDRNGAGIRGEGQNLTVRGCVFHHNENGILAGRQRSQILVENSIFYENGFGDGQSHNIYVGRIDELTIRGSYFSHANIGHNIKSRALETNILYSRIVDAANGQSSYLVDLPNGGRARLIGNVLQQGPNAVNGTLVSFSAESVNAKSGELLVINNTFVNDRHSGIFLKIATPFARVHAQNNIFFGKGVLSNREVRSISNLRAESESGWIFKNRIFVDRDGFDYHLTENSPAINAGTELGLTDLPELQPRFEYEDKAKIISRRTDNGLDIGAFEWRHQ